MPAPRLCLITADDQLAEEVDLVCWAVEAGFCTHDSLAAVLELPRSTLSQILEGRLSARPGLLRGLLLHLAPEERRAVLVEQARRWAVDPGELLREHARLEEVRRAWASVCQMAAGRAAEAPPPMTEPVRLVAPVARVGRVREADGPLLALMRRKAA